MKKKQFRITAFDGADKSFCAPMIMTAALNNGGERATLEKIKAIGDAQILLYPVLYPDTSLEIIDGRVLHVDKKIGEDYKTVLCIEEVEIFEMDLPEEPEEENVILALHGQPLKN